MPLAAGHRIGPMELVEGNDLAGPMAVEDALPVAKQIIEALEAAHEK
jgi:hypothetical protein